MYICIMLVHVYQFWFWSLKSIHMPCRHRALKLKLPHSKMHIQITEAAALMIPGIDPAICDVAKTHPHKGFCQDHSHNGFYMVYIYIYM